MTDYDKMLRETVVDLYVSGKRSPGSIARIISNGGEPPVDLVEAVEEVLRDPSFQREVTKRLSDPISYTTERFRRNLARAALEIERCLTQNDDWRVKLQAAKLSLEIGGICQTQRFEICTPKMYAEAIRPLLGEPKQLESGDDPDTDPEETR